MKTTNVPKSLETQFWFFFGTDPLPDVWYAQSVDAALTEMQELEVTGARVATDAELTALVCPFWHIALPNGYCRVGKTTDDAEWIHRVYPDALSVREATAAEALESWKMMRLEQDLRNDEDFERGWNEYEGG